MSSQYLFGDTDIATQRLQVLAEVFADSSAAFLRDTVTATPRLVLDLGCGPGYSTRFLADVLSCDRVVGLDNSEHFILLAQQTKRDGVAFHLHDVTAVPFPVGPSDLLYCRFLLTHLTEPAGVIGKWATQLRRKGLLLVEEVEWIHTTNAVFSAYLNMLAALMEHQSRKLNMGPDLDALEDSMTLTKQRSQVRRFPVSTDKAATMFVLNMQAWKHQPFIRAHHSASMMTQLETDLRAFTKTASREIEIEWGLRQIAFERV